MGFDGRGKAAAGGGGGVHEGLCQAGQSELFVAAVLMALVGLPEFGGQLLEREEVCMKAFAKLDKVGGQQHSVAAHASHWRGLGGPAGPQAVTSTGLMDAVT